MKFKFSNILSSLYQLLGAKKEEEAAMGTLLLYGFFMGVFLASFQPASLNLFIKHYADRVDEAYLVQGIYGLIGAFIYSLIHKNIRFSIIIKLQPIFILLVTIFGYILYDRYHYYEVSYLLFVFFGPFQVISNLIFWGLFGRIFKTYQSKRVIGGIDTGTLTAMILTFFTVPFLLDESSSLFNDSIDLFFISGSAICMLFFVTFGLTRVFNINEIKKLTKVERKKVSFKTLLSGNLPIYLSFFLICSTIMAKFVDFSYINIIDKQFPEENPRLSFLSFAEGSIMVLSFLMQTFFNDRIIFNYGLKISLMILPAILFIFTFIAIPIGFTTLSSVGAILPFFILIAVSKIISSALRDSLENPTYKMFFLIYKPTIRFEIQNKIEGIVNQLGTIIAGVTMTLLGLTWFKELFFEFTVNQALIILLTVIIIIFFVIRKMYNYYRKELQDSLKLEVKINHKQSSLLLFSQIEEEINEKKPNTKYYALRILEMADPLQFQNILKDYLQHKNSIIRMYALNRVEEMALTENTDYIKEMKKKEKNFSVRDKAIVIADKFEKEFLRKELKSFHFFVMGNSNEPQDRLTLAKLLKEKYLYEYWDSIYNLMHDENYYVRKITCMVVAKVNTPNVWTVFIDMLSNEIYRPLAISALVSMGGDQLGQILEREYQKTNTSKSTKVAILEILGRLATKNCKIIISNIYEQDKEVTLEASQWLGNLDISFKGDTIKRMVIVTKVMSFAEIMYWNKVTISELDKEIDEELIVALKTEIRYCSDAIFILLALIHDKESINVIKENIFSSDFNKQVFAIELIGIIVDENIKKTLTSVFDEIKITEMVARLEYIFPRKSYDRKQALYEIVSRNRDKLGTYTKCLALETIFKEEKFYFVDALVSNLFSEEHILKELAFYYFYYSDNEKTQRIANRTKDRNNLFLINTFRNNSFESIQDDYKLGFHRLKKLMKFDLIKLLSSREVYKLYSVLQSMALSSGRSLIDNEKKGTTNVYFVLEGKLKHVIKNKYFKEYDIIGIEELLNFEIVENIEILENAKLIVIPFSVIADMLFTVGNQYKNIQNLIINDENIIFKTSENKKKNLIL